MTTAEAAAATLRAVTRDGREFLLAVEIRQGRIGHAAARHWIERTAADTKRDWLLAAPAIGQEVGDQLRAAGRSFLDATGNCFLCLADGQFVADFRAERRAALRPAVTRAAPANLRVLFALLADPRNLRRPIRELATRSSTSHQTVATTLAGLRAESHLARIGRSGHAWVGGRTTELVDRFVAGWRTQLRPRLIAATLRTGGTPEQDETAIERLLEREAVAFGFGGSAGACRIAPYYRSAITVVHADTTWRAEWSRELRAAQSQNGSLVVLQTMGADDIDGDTRHVHPLLLYAELQTSTDPREREFAREFLPQVVERVMADG